MLLHAALLTRAITKPHDPGGTTDAYRTIIETIGGMVSWWRMGDPPGTGTAIDEEGVQDGVYIGGTTLEQGSLIAGTDDSAVALNGATGYVQVDNNAAYSLSAGTIAIWFRANSLTADFGLINKNAVGTTNPGDFFVWWDASDGLRVVFQYGGVQYSILVAGMLQANTVHCLFVRWGAAAPFDVWLKTGNSLQQIGAHPSEAGTLVNNVQPWMFGRVANIGADSYLPGVLDDVLLFNRRLTEAEMASVAQTTPIIPPEGDYEDIVTGLTPAIYMRMAEPSGTMLADDSGNGRNGTITGTPTAYNVAHLPATTAAINGGLNLGNAASISIPHAAADVALTFPTDWINQQTTDGTRFIADCAVSIWFKPNSLPSVGNKAVVVAKSNAQTPGVAASYDGSWEAYIDSNGAVHVECRSFRGRPSRVRTRNGAVVAGGTYHLVVQLSYDGVGAWLNGAKFEDGHANLLHVYGLAADIRGTTYANTNAWTIGKAAWGGQANLVVDEFAVYLRMPSTTITQANVNSLAEKISTPAPLEHHIWGQRYVNGSSNIQAAIDNVSGLGGGTVLINPGTYAVNLILKSGVRLKRNGSTGTVIINGKVNTAQTQPNMTTLNDAAAGNFIAGARTLSIANHGRSVGDVVHIQGTAGDPTPMRHDRRWRSLSKDSNVPDSEAFVIESQNSSGMTFEGNGAIHTFATADRETVYAFTPTRDVAIEDIRFNGFGTGSDSGGIGFRFCVNARLVNVTATLAHVDGNPARFNRDCLYCTTRDCRWINFSGTIGGINSGIMYASGSKDGVSFASAVENGKRVCDVAGEPGYGVASRIEFHKTTHTGTGQNPTVGSHGTATDCIYWDFVVNYGPDVSGWKPDYRWGVCGGVSGFLVMGDGSADAYVRDIHVRSVFRWFSSTEGFTVGVDRGVFENLTNVGTPTENHLGVNYGTGAAVNRYRNVNDPSGSWQAL